MSRFACCILALLAVSTANAASIKWTGYASNGQWGTATNWYPDQVPGPSDDVTINRGGNVTITTPVTVQSISIGDAVGEYPYLIVDNSLLLETTLDVKGNGGIVMNSGLAMISGQVTMGGNFVFKSGTASGSWNIASPGKMTLGGAAEKAFTSCAFNIGVDVDMSGLIILNQSSTVTVGTGATATASAAFSVQAGDSTAVKFDTSAGTLTYTGGGTFQMMAPWSVGTFNLVAGNLTLFDSVTFGSTFSVPSGSTVKTLGVASVAMPAGVSGAGRIHAEGKSLTVGGANFSGLIDASAGVFESTAASTIATLNVGGSTIMVNKPLTVGTVTMIAGQIQGTSTFTVGGGNLMSAGFNINASTVFTGAFTVAGSVISLGSLGALHIASTATFTTTGAVQISGPPKTGGIHNMGMINAKGAFSLTNVDMMGSGSVTVSDTFTVGTITMSQAVVALVGNGKFIGATTQLDTIAAITGTPGVTGSIGSYSFTCDKKCKSITTSGIPTTKFIFAVSA